MLELIQSPAFFYLFAILAIASSLLVIFKKNPVTSAFSLVFVFFCFAGIYALMGAHLIAGIQVLVYAGAIMVLFVFVIMLLNADSPSLDLVARVSKTRFVGTLIGAAAVLSLLAYIFKNAVPPSPAGKHTPQAIEAMGGNTRALSELMFTDFILPFELTSILLLAVVVAVVAIALRKPHLTERSKIRGGAK